MQMLNTVAPCWRVKPRSAIWLLFAVVLTGCCSPTAVTPQIPEPAADLMIPAPTGSEVLQRATRNMETWLPMPPDGPTK